MKRLIPILFFAILISSICFGQYFNSFFILNPHTRTYSVSEDCLLGHYSHEIMLDFEPNFFISSPDSHFIDIDWGYEYFTRAYIVGKNSISTIETYNTLGYEIVATTYFPDTLEILTMDDNYPYATVYRNSNQISIMQDTIHFADEFCNTPRYCKFTNNKYYVLSADFDPIDSTYGQGMIWKLSSRFEILDSQEIGMNPTFMLSDIICNPYNNEIHVLCSGDGETSSGIIYIVCRNCLEILDSLWLGGNPSYLAFNDRNDCVYTCVSDPDISGSGQLLYYNSLTREVICDITSAGNELSGTNFNRIHCYNNRLYLPSIDSNWVEIIETDSIGITDRILVDTGEGVSDILGARVILYSDSIEETIAPGEYDIFSVFPNPFNCSCIFDIPGDANIEIFDIEGRLIKTIDGNLWTPESHVQSGVYLAKMTYENQTYSKKIIYLK